MSSTSDGLKRFGKVVRWISTMLALYVVWLAWETKANDGVAYVIFATVIFVIGNGIGWWVQVFAERNQ